MSNMQNGNGLGEDGNLNKRPKGESEENPQKGALGIDASQKEPHRKDNNGEEDEAPTKKGANAV